MEVHGPGGLSGPQRIDLDRIQAQRPAELTRLRPSATERRYRMLPACSTACRSTGHSRGSVAQLKELIHSGRYETPERIAAAVDKIMEEL